MLGIALPVGHPGEPGDLGLHDRLGEHADALAQEVDVAVGDRLAHALEHRHPVLGHRGVPPCRRFLARRREDDAVAASLHGLLRCDTKCGDTTWPSPPPWRPVRWLRDVHGYRPAPLYPSIMAPKEHAC
jgi:hypothetical protein